jgi:cytochrome b561
MCSSIAIWAAATTPEEEAMPLQARARTTRYSTSQILIHWLTALFILSLFPMGLVMTRLGPGPTTNLLYELHKSFGLIVLCLALLRVAIRLLRGAPPVVDNIPRWQKAAAHASHLALYLLIFLVPLSGLAATSACCAPVNLFWTIPFTLPVEGGMEVARRIFLAHNILSASLAAILLVHAGAALHHHYALRDETLRRMLPGGRTRRE